MRIAAGETLHVAWTGHGGDLKPEGHPNTYPWLEWDGLYFIRASLVVKTPDGTRIRLESNEAPLSRNGSVQRPKTGAVTIRHIEVATGDLTIDAGADGGIAIGDRFRVSLDLSSAWILEVTRLYPEFAVCRVVDRRTADGRVVLSSMPSVGKEGRWVPPPKDAPAP